MALNKLMLRENPSSSVRKVKYNYLKSKGFLTPFYLIIAVKFWMSELLLPTCIRGVMSL